MKHETEEAMLDYCKYVPHVGIPFVVETSWGEKREAVLDWLAMGYRLTDCTHPMQNCHLSSFDIVKWRYVDEQQMLDCNFSENTYIRDKEAERIIDGIKVTWIDKVKFYISDAFHKFKQWDKIGS